MRAKSFAAAFIVLILFSSCSLLFGNHFEITNKTGHELRDVRVVFADASGERQSLGAGETFSFRPSPKHDGGISVSYTESGKVVKHELGYVAPPISMTCKFEVTSNDVRGECK